MTTKELLAHPSVQREFNRFRTLGGDVVIEGNVLDLVRNIIPLIVAETFARRIRELDSEGLLTIRVKP